MAQSGDAPIFLIGYRGTGKTSVARELAGQLGYDWVDADDVVEQQAGKTIAAIFADEGEAAFRDWEARVVAALSRKRRTVVALGGGAVLREENRRGDLCGRAGGLADGVGRYDSRAGRGRSDDRQPPAEPDHGGRPSGN